MYFSDIVGCQIMRSYRPENDTFMDLEAQHVSLYDCAKRCLNALNCFYGWAYNLGTMMVREAII